MPSIEQWNATWEDLGIASTPALQACFESLPARYSEPHRKYHTLQARARSNIARSLEALGGTVR